MKLFPNENFLKLGKKNNPIRKISTEHKQTMYMSKYMKEFLDLVRIKTQIKMSLTLFKSCHVTFSLGLPQLL